MKKSAATVVFLTLRTPAGSSIRAEAWLQGGELRIRIDGFTDLVLLFEPGSALEACKDLEKLFLPEGES